MKNIVSTIIVFGSIFILIVAGAFVFDKFNGFGLIDNVDSSLNNGIKKVLESEIDNITADSAAAQVDNNQNNYINDNISDNQSDNISENKEITTIDNISNSDNQPDNNRIDNNSLDNVTIDNESILKDNKTLDNNTPSDNTSDGMFI